MAAHIDIAELLDDAGWLRSLAASLIGDPAQADDLVQDTWLAALRRPPRAAGESRPWLARVARNLARNTRRDRSRREAREEFAHEERALPSPDALAQQAEAQRLLAEAVTRLAEPLRDVVVLRYFQGLDSGAAAARLGVPASTVRTRLQKALEELRADLDRRFQGGREGWGLVLAPLAGRASVTASHAPALATGSGLLGALSPALLASAGGICALAVAGSIYFGIARRAGPAEAAIAVAPIEAALVDPQETREHAAGGREPLDPLPAGAATESSNVTRVPAAVAPAAQQGTELSGTILVDGRPPEWPIELALGPADPPVNPGELVPRRRLRSPPPVVVGPEQGGRFALGPLPPEWSGRLSVGGFDYAFEDGETSLAIDAPRSGLVLRLRSGPALYGRILGPDGRAVPGLEGKYHLRTGLIGQIGEELVLRMELTERFLCREDGRFRIPVDDPEGWGALTLRVDAEEHGYLQHEIPKFVTSDGRDLGDLVLEPVRALAFTVRDPRGAPIEGAFARVGDPSVSRRSAPTGPDGAGRLACAPDRATSVCVSAAGYADRVLEVDPRRALEVVLEPLSVLDVRLGDSLRALADRLVLSAERPAFVWDESGWVDGRLAVQAELGSVKPAVRRQPAAAGQRFEYEFQRQHDGRFRLVGLVPDVLVNVEVRDARGSVLAADAVSVASQATAKLELGGPSTASPEPLRVKVPMRRSAAAPR